MTQSSANAQVVRDPEILREATDFDLLVRLWNAGPASRDVALEMADKNRVNARSERK